MIKPLETDKLFDDSPDTGWPECICSRCSQVIGENECPIRCWTVNEKNEVDSNSKEYRYCEKCSEGMGLVFLKTYDEYENEF